MNIYNEDLNYSSLSDNVNDQIAFRPNSLLDNRIKTMHEMEKLGIPQPNLQKLKDMDMKQFQEKGIPLSLSPDNYTSLINNRSEPTAMGMSITMNDAIPLSEQLGYYSNSGIMENEDDLMNYNEFYNTPIVEAPTGAAAGIEALKPFLPGGVLRFLNSMIRPGADQSAMGIGGLYQNEIGDMDFARQYGDPDVTRLLGSDPRVDPYGKNIVSGARDYNQGVKDLVSKYGDVNYKTDFMKKKQQYYKELVQDMSKRAEQRAIEEARARSRAQTARQQRALAGSQDWTGASSDYRGGDDTPQGRATGNYHDPYDPGYAD